jgi:hypothetical protein
MPLEVDERANDLSLMEIETHHGLWVSLTAAGVNALPVI